MKSLQILSLFVVLIVRASAKSPSPVVICPALECLSGCPGAHQVDEYGCETCGCATDLAGKALPVSTITTESVSSNVQKICSCRYAYSQPGVPVEPKPKAPCIKITDEGVEIKRIPGLGEDGKTPDQGSIITILPSLKPSKLPPGVTVIGIPGGVKLDGIKGLPGDKGINDLTKVIETIPNLDTDLNIKLEKGEPPKKLIIEKVPDGITITNIPGFNKGEVPSISKIKEVLPGIQEVIPPGGEITGVNEGIKITKVPLLDEKPETIDKVLPGLKPILDNALKKADGDKGPPRVPPEEEAPTLPGKVTITDIDGGIRLENLPGISKNKLPTDEEIKTALPGLKESLPQGAVVKPALGGVEITQVPGLNAKPGTLQKVLPGVKEALNNAVEKDALTLPGKVTITDIDGGVRLENLPGISKNKLPTEEDINTALPGLKESLPPGGKLKPILGGVEITQVPGLNAKPGTLQKVLPGVKEALGNAVEKDAQTLPPKVSISPLDGGGIRLTKLPGIAENELPTEEKINKVLPGLKESLPLGAKVKPTLGGVDITDVPGLDAKPETIQKVLPGLKKVLTDAVENEPLVLPGKVSIEKVPNGIKLLNIPGIAPNELPDKAKIQNAVPGLVESLPPGGKVKGVLGGLTITDVPGLDEKPGTLQKVLPGVKQALDNAVEKEAAKLPGKITIDKVPNGVKLLNIPGIEENELPDKAKIDKILPGLQESLPLGGKVKGVLGGVAITGVPDLTDDVTKLNKVVPSLRPLLEQAVQGSTLSNKPTKGPLSQGSQDVSSGLPSKGGGKELTPATQAPTLGPRKPDSTVKILPVQPAETQGGLPGKGNLSIKTVKPTAAPVTIPVIPPKTLPGGLPVVTLSPVTKVPQRPTETLIAGGLQVKGYPGLAVDGSTPSVAQILQAVPELNKLPQNVVIAGVPGGFKLTGFQDLIGDFSTTDLAIILQYFPGLAKTLGYEVTSQVQESTGGGVMGAGGIKIVGVPGLGDGNTVPTLAQITQRLPALRADKLPAGASVVPIAGGFQVLGVMGLSDELNKAFMDTLTAQISSGSDVIIPDTDELLAQMNKVPDYCGPVTCKMLCPSGYITDSKGCPICSCRKV